MKLKYIMASFLIGSCAFISSCKDDFADINTNPTIVSKPDPRYLFTQALANFDGHDYFAWYYDYNNMLRWSQTVASTGGNENLMTTMSNSGKMGSQVYNVMEEMSTLMDAEPLTVSLPPTSHNTINDSEESATVDTRREWEKGRDEYLNWEAQRILASMKRT